jgi:hypothetical protein
MPRTCRLQGLSPGLAKRSQPVNPGYRSRIELDGGGFQDLVAVEQKWFCFSVAFQHSQTFA